MGLYGKARVDDQRSNLKDSILRDVYLGPPIPVYRYSEYRDTALNVGGINIGIVPRNTVASGINNFTGQQSPLSTLWLFV